VQGVDDIGKNFGTAVFLTGKFQRDGISPRRQDRNGSGYAERLADSGRDWISIHKCLNLMGNYLSSQFESSEMGRQVPF